VVGGTVVGTGVVGMVVEEGVVVLGDWFVEAHPKSIVIKSREVTIMDSTFFMEEPPFQILVLLL
jgi:hypothetical protein